MNEMLLSKQMKIIGYKSAYLLNKLVSLHRQRMELSTYVFSNITLTHM